MTTSFIAMTVSLFFILNSLGNIPLFVGLLSKFDVKKQRRIIVRELLFALAILLLFNFFGDDFLRMMGISQSVIGVSGGILLFIIALSMIFPRPEDKKKTEASELMIVPLAIPIVAGPGAIATVMIYSEHLQNPWITSLLIILAWIPSCIILLLSSNIKYVLGQKGLLACQKMGGMLISLIAVQMIYTGATRLLQEALHIPPTPIEQLQTALLGKRTQYTRSDSRIGCQGASKPRD